MLARLSDVNTWIQRFSFDEIYSLSTSLPPLPLVPLLTSPPTLSHSVAFLCVVVCCRLPLYCIGHCLLAQRKSECECNVAIECAQRAQRAQSKIHYTKMWWECSTQILFFHSHNVWYKTKTNEQNRYWRWWWLYISKRSCIARSNTYRRILLNIYEKNNAWSMMLFFCFIAFFFVSF